MKTLFLKIGFISCLILVVSALIQKFIYLPLALTDYSYGEKTIHLKRKFLEYHREDYNLFFMGSSHVLLQFDPASFDRIASSDSFPIHSFNFGISALESSEMFYLSKNILSEYKNGSRIKNDLPLKYVLLELNQITLPKYRNLHTTRMFYWYNWSNYLFTMNANLNSSFSFVSKLIVAVTHTIGYLDKILNLGYINDVNTFKRREFEVNLKLDTLKNNYNGFEPTLIARQKFLSNANEISLSVREENEKSFSRFENNPGLLNKYNKVYLKKINETIEAFTREGINPIFVFTPLAEKGEYDEIIPILDQIDSKHKIELADCRKYPQFYQVENLADATHLNKKGAEIFTYLLAEKFNELRKNEIKN